MLSTIIIMLKMSLTVLWILALLGLFSISPLPTEYQFYLLALAIIVLLVHFIEFFAMKANFKNHSKSEMNFLQTMLWGFGYWLPILKHYQEQAKLIK
ncbi:MULTISPECIES: DUF1145 domain-containing protein [unclassified Colwellia]|uniref:DUF1145 domain-containing protein n=1 Tax=unclassified Colwellia TaxID=196834 RepID=UPI0015F3B1C6|nr:MULTISPECIES: DUF1145 domain-containing protein [unclassified Colwellia]MBA6350836.1 DUF1145 domain-containing protein [Colwellia sp. BRX9-1]MBA6354451.1 DUF1145 domain-containing protein [Colwellia sp. BRX8-3]MBA6358282.1 DUF1145 domain-containing protein [Colwellia sp. BRX8-6]MBA6365965.1 DUF1145 domain-containing protein [Colwellia sp. BRX8-5]MBA6374072.1 DUF1145 domain-containing protein [Colwellia sp. BRX8-2]